MEVIISALLPSARTDSMHEDCIGNKSIVACILSPISKSVIKISINPHNFPVDTTLKLESLLVEWSLSMVTVIGWLV